MLQQQVRAQPGGSSSVRFCDVQPPFAFLPCMRSKARSASKGFYAKSLAGAAGFNHANEKKRPGFPGSPAVAFFNLLGGINPLQPQLAQPWLQPPQQLPGTSICFCTMWQTFT